jgi:hypothetical protein
MCVSHLVAKKIGGGGGERVKGQKLQIPRKEGIFVFLFFYAASRGELKNMMIHSNLMNSGI